MFNGNILPINYPEEEKVGWSAEEHARHKRLMADAVFGQGHKVDANTGKPIEGGIGSATNVTWNSQEAERLLKERKASLMARAGLD